jgi:hypothetical protein
MRCGEQTSPAVVLRPGDKEISERTVRSTTAGAGAARSARIVLLASDGLANGWVAQDLSQVGVAP